ncbi:hypothetical protein IP70_16745 [alpha proteobacterium AAP38]|nr:hypothetical protein IP70_16745 [alpha proteobacterium AAP38]
MTDDEWAAAASKAKSLGYRDTSSWIRDLVQYGITGAYPAPEQRTGSFPTNLAERLMLRAALLSWKALESGLSEDQAVAIRKEVDGLIRQQNLIGNGGVNG